MIFRAYEIRYNLRNYNAMFSTETSEVEALRKIRKFPPISQSGNVQKTEMVCSLKMSFLLKTLHCSYVNCNEFHKHERLFVILVQQVP